MQDLRDLIHTRKKGVSKIDLKTTEDKLGAVFPRIGGGVWWLSIS